MGARATLFDKIWSSDAIPVGLDGGSNKKRPRAWWNLRRPESVLVSPSFDQDGALTMKVRFAATVAILSLFVIPIAAHAQVGEGAREGANEGSRAAGPVGGVVGGVLGGAAGAVGGALGVHPITDTTTRSIATLIMRVTLGVYPDRSTGKAPKDQRPSPGGSAIE
jgi:hypothetical protein